MLSYGKYSGKRIMISDIQATKLVKDPYGDIKFRYYDTNNWTFYLFKHKILNFGIVLPFIVTKSL